MYIEHHSTNISRANNEGGGCFDLHRALRANENFAVLIEDHGDFQKYVFKITM